MGNRIIIDGDYPNGRWWEKTIYDQFNNKIDREDSHGYREKFKYDSNNNMIYYETSNGYWTKYEYDSNGNKIYSEYSSGNWYKYDSNGFLINKGRKDLFPSPEQIKQYIENGK